MEARCFVFIAALALAGAGCSDSGDKAIQEQTNTQEEATQEQSDNQADNEEPTEESEEKSEESGDDNALVDYVKTPIDKAKAVEGMLQEAVEQQREDIDEATE